MTRCTSVTRGLCLSLLLPALGCGQQGPVRFDVSGKVTFAGKPIPDGWVCFTPDTTKGNSGPQGVARIQAGTFNTAGKDGKGITGGPMVVRIEGFDGSTEVRHLFAPYETNIDLPHAATTRDFDVPASWADQPIPVATP
jgi:hypothetical protein